MNSTMMTETRTKKTRERSQATVLSEATHPHISLHTKEPVIQLLNQHVADTLDLYTQTKQAHWNVCGPQFFQLHILFDKLAEEVEPFIDLIAERVVTLGGVALGTARVVGRVSTLPEYPLEAMSCEEHLRALVERYAAYATSTRAVLEQSDKHNDVVTVDMLTDILGTAEKHLWLLEAHLESSTG